MGFLVWVVRSDSPLSPVAESLAFGGKSKDRSGSHLIINHLVQLIFSLMKFLAGRWDDQELIEVKPRLVVFWSHDTSQRGCYPAMSPIAHRTGPMNYSSPCYFWYLIYSARPIICKVYLLQKCNSNFYVSVKRLEHEASSWSDWSQDEVAVVFYWRRQSHIIPFLKWRLRIRLSNFVHIYELSMDCTQRQKNGMRMRFLPWSYPEQ